MEGGKTKEKGRRYWNGRNEETAIELETKRKIESDGTFSYSVIGVCIVVDRLGPNWRFKITVFWDVAPYSRSFPTFQRP
jgi:hypothetical protein